MEKWFSAATRPLSAMRPASTSRGRGDHSELGADPIGLGGAQLGVQGEGFPPVLTGLLRSAVGLMGGGQALTRAGLLVVVLGLVGHLERGGVLSPGGGGAAGGEQHLAEAVQREGPGGQVAGLRADAERLAEQVAGPLVVTLPEPDQAECGQGLGFADPVADFPEQRERLSGPLDGRS